MNKIFEKLTDIELLSLCMFGEARGEGLDGMLAVGSIVVNRLKKPLWWGRSIKEIILKPEQFSCFNEGDPNLETLRKIAVDVSEYVKIFETFRACSWIARGILEGELYSNVGNATHYHAVSILPAWAQRKSMLFIRQIGRHKFYVE